MHQFVCTPAKFFPQIWLTFRFFSSFVFFRFCFTSPTTLHQSIRPRRGLRLLSRTLAIQSRNGAARREHQIRYKIQQKNQRRTGPCRSGKTIWSNWAPKWTEAKQTGECSHSVGRLTRSNSTTGLCRNWACKPNSKNNGQKLWRH